MPNINLIPISRRDARRRRRNVRWCAAGCAAYALAATLFAAVAWCTWGGDDPQIRQQLAKAEQEIHRNEASLAQAKARLVGSQSVALATHHIEDQPDWSVLLALLAGKADDQIVIRGCEVRTSSSPAAGNGPALIVSVGGVARSPADAQQYVLRLERSGLFERVTLLDTHREPFLSSEGAAFRIESILSSGLSDEANPGGKDKP